MFLEEKVDLILSKLDALATIIVKPTPDSAAKAGAVETSKAADSKAADSSKPVESEPLDTKVARLAKELLNKSRPKLISALKELDVERARDLKPEQLESAAKVFEKALTEAA